jgi:hypothetical protein
MIIKFQCFATYDTLNILLLQVRLFWKFQVSCGNSKALCLPSISSMCSEEGIRDIRGLYVNFSDTAVSFLITTHSMSSSILALYPHYYLTRGYVAGHLIMSQVTPLLSPIAGARPRLRFTSIRL